jgi:hypothetical protein
MDQFITNKQIVNNITDKVGIRSDFKDLNITEIYYNIDSSNRQQNDVCITNGTIPIQKNSMSYIPSYPYNLLTVNVNNSLTKQTKIQLQNITPDPINIKTKWIDNSNISHDLFTFNPGYTYITFICNFNSVNASSYNPFFSFENISFLDLQTYDTSQMSISLSLYSNGSNKFIGNVPINWLNSTHRIYMTNPDPTSTYEINAPDINGNVAVLNGFYIKLPQPFSGVYTLNDTFISMAFNYIGGILLSELQTPTVLYSATKTALTFIVSRKPYYNLPFLNKIGMFVNSIDNIITGCSNSNSFVINASYNNVLSVEIINSTLPLFNYTIDNIINKFYWQNINDDVIYTVVIPYGPYTAANLISTLQTLINNTLYTTAIYSAPFLNKNHMTITIDNQNNITFKNYLVSNISSPIQDVQPPPPVLGNGVGTYTLTILHYNHNLQVGDVIIFDNFIANLGISVKTLNTQQTVASIISINEYTVILYNVTLDDARIYTLGGENAFIYIPLQTRFLFTDKHSIYKQLGFRQLQNQTKMITNYNTVITNNDLYANEINTTNTYIHHVPLKLNIIDYYLIKLNNFENVFYNGYSYFCKLNNNASLLTNAYYPFNSVIYAPHNPFTINNFTVELYNQDNELADIDNINYSIFIKITLLDYIPNNTNINQRMYVR